MFDDLLQKYTSEYQLKSVKTTNLGSLNKLQYHVKMKQTGMEKALIDELRCRNGNLEISLALAAESSDL